MSDDFLETIWVQYAVETEEHIESIESLLVKADAEELNAEEISGLFRAFHSLKGLSRVMELTALEAIAHRAEDLLGLVREGQTSLDKTTVDVLLRGLDAIKVLRDLAVSQRSDGDKPEDLLKELERSNALLRRENEKLRATITELKDKLAKSVDPRDPKTGRFTKLIKR
jgi:chemotaxis protein histidine kinase CheA